MKCAIEIQGKRYESADFTERQCTGFLAAVIGSNGMAVGEIFDQAFTDAGISNKALKTYNSAESADRDLAYWFGKLVPSCDIPIDSINTIELITIATVLMQNLYADAPPQAKVAPPRPTNLGKTIRETEIISQDSSLNYPPRSTLTDDEIHAIGYAARGMNHSHAIVECWYQWWKAIDSIDEESLDPKDALDLIIEQSGNPFTETDSIRYYTLIQAYLQQSTDLALAA